MQIVRETVALHFQWIQLLREICTVRRIVRAHTRTHALSLSFSFDFHVMKHDDKLQSNVHYILYRRLLQSSETKGRSQIYPLRSAAAQLIRMRARTARVVVPVSFARSRGANGGLPRVGTYRVSRGVGYRLSITPRGVCRTSPTYAREILHATGMARPAINYGGTWYSVHEIQRGETLRSYT